MKLNLGGGLQKIPGFQNIDRKLGTEVYPLSQFADNSVEEIRASHILEHFPYGSLQAVVQDWVRALRPGGWLRVAVPDFDWIVKAYNNGYRDHPLIQGYLFGGQVDENDYHKALLNPPLLAALLKQAGLVEIQPWQSEIADCASLDVSLNLMGRKPTVEEDDAPQIMAVDVKCAALASIPRLGFQAHWGVVQKSFRRLGEFDIPLFKFGGAFWEQGMQRGFTGLMEQGWEWIITIDYDSIFNSADVKELLTLAQLYPEADAITGWQSHRGGNKHPLFTMRDMSGRNRLEISATEFEGDLTQVTTGHFGLTLIKLARLKDIPKPWFWSQPNPQTGDWDDGRRDADIYFWEKWREHGRTLFLANRIRIGHLEEEITWIDQDFKVVRQSISDFNENGKPEACK